jgi:hypothetical protein
LEGRIQAPVPELNANTPRGFAALAVAVQLSRQKVHRTVIARVWELADGGMSPFEVSSITGLPIQMVNLILRGTTPSGVPK